MAAQTLKPYILWSSKPKFTEGLYDNEKPDIKQLADVLKYTGENTGNLVYLEGIKSILPEGTPVTPWGTCPDDASCLIFPAANQLGKHTDLADLANFWNTKTKKAIVLGLGIQAAHTQKEIVLKAGTEAWLKSIISELKTNSSFLICRGEETEKFINSRANSNVAVAAGCPSQFISNPTEILKDIQNRLSAGLNTLSVNANDSAWKNMFCLEKKLIAEVIKQDGKYIVQAPAHSILAGVLNSKKTRKRLNESDVECFDDLVNTEFFKNYAHVYLGIPNWEFCLKQYDYNLGTRIHGCMLSLACGVPSFLFSVDRRTEEFAKTMFLPYTSDTAIEDPINYSKERLYTHDFKKMISVWREHAQIFNSLLALYGVTPNSNFLNNWII